MQMKKTHDAAMVIMERVYGERPRFNYYIGASQGGRAVRPFAQRDAPILEAATCRSRSGFTAAVAVAISRVGCRLVG